MSTNISARQALKERIRKKHKPSKSVSIRDRFEKLEWHDGARADDFIAHNAERIRHATGIGWVVYDDVRWDTVDASKRIKHLAREHNALIRGEAESLNPDLPIRRKVINESAKADTRTKIESMLALAEINPRIRCSPSVFDAPEPLLSCQNGVVDLKTGKLLKHDPELMITRCCPTSYDAKAKCPTWESAVENWLGNDKHLMRYFQLAIGYSVTALCDQRSVFFLVGPPHTGKSVCLETLSSVLGSNGDGYAATADPSSFMLSRTNRMRCDLAVLRGARFVTSIETSKRQRLNESFVKALTGGDRIVAEQKYKDPIAFKPSFVVWFGTNYTPTADGSDDALMQRVKIIPFRHVMPKTPGFEIMLRREHEGILKWIVDGARMFYSSGRILHAPKSVEREREKYEQEMNPFARFLKECCALRTDARTAKSVLRDCYVVWCEKHKTNAEPLDDTKFKIALERQGVQSKKSGGIRYWRGIEVVDRD